MAVPESHAPQSDGPGGLLPFGPIAYGCWRFGGTSTSEASVKVNTAIECGMTLIDTAAIYGYTGDVPAADESSGFGAAESLLGRVLAESPGLRDQITLATKGGIFPPVPYDSSPTYLRASVDESLRRLQVDRIDLFQVHRPDLLVHPESLAAVLGELVAAGKVRAVGVSNYSVAQTRALTSYLEVPLVSTQPEFSPLELAPLMDGTLDHAMQHGVVPLAWSPLGGGRLGLPPTNDERAEAVARICDRIASEQGVTRTAVVLAWVMRHPAGCVPIVGTQRPERIRECARAVEVILSRDEWYEILVAGRGEPMP
ncbi:MAG: aldo/keto reductase [Actinomycetia bacterium]|nr:aldo/keto reductase [Actinomycetes bacterium]